MSNNFTSDPILLDTAGNPLTIGRVFNIFKSVEWVNPIAVGDRAYLKDAQGQVLCDYTCTQAGEGKRKDFGYVGTPFDGPLNLVQLDSGYLLLARV
jgi:hypothetical protein